MDLFAAGVAEAWQQYVTTPRSLPADMHAHAQVPIRVVYLDRSMGAAMAGVGDVNHHDFIPDELRQQGAAQQPPALHVHLLYRPGHYDILYPLPAGAASHSIAASS